MKHRSLYLSLMAVAMLVPASHSRALAFDIVVDGKPVAAIIVEPAEPNAPAARPAKRGKAAHNEAGDEMAASVLAEWVKKMSGADLPVGPTAPEGKPAIYVGPCREKGNK